MTPLEIKISSTVYKRHDKKFCIDSCGSVYSVGSLMLRLYLTEIVVMFDYLSCRLFIGSARPGGTANREADLIK